MRDALVVHRMNGLLTILKVTPTSGMSKRRRSSSSSTGVMHIGDGFRGMALTVASIQAAFRALCLLKMVQPASDIAIDKEATLPFGALCAALGILDRSKRPG